MCEYIGYYISSNNSSYKSLKENNDKLSGVIAAFLEVDEEGNIIENINNDDINLLTVLQKNLKIIPMVQNRGLKSEVSNKLLTNKDKWKYLVEELKRLLLKYKFKAVNFDLEGIKGKYKSIYTEFTLFVKKHLNRSGIELSLSIPAKTENHSDSSWTTAYDYQDLGIIADKTIIMAYDYHWPGGPPGPVAPFFWVRDVIDYAIMNIPVQKLYIGLPFYGYAWEVNGNSKRAHGLSYTQIMEIKEKHKCKIEWDQESRTPYIKLADREIWFENIASIMEKIKLINKYNLPGVAFWRLGLESPQIWNNL